MKTKILFIISFVFAAYAANAQIHYIDVQAGNSYPIGVTTSTPGVTYDWTLTSDPNDILSNDAVVNAGGTSTVTIDVRATAVALQTATVSVVGYNGSCDGTPQTATIRVGVSTFVASFGAFTTQSICQGDNSAAIPVTFTATGVAVPASFVYYIDADNNNVQDVGEADVTGSIAALASTIPAAAYAVAGVNSVRIKSVSGTDGANTVSSPQTAVVHGITVNERPVITWF